MRWMLLCVLPLALVACQRDVPPVPAGSAEQDLPAAEDVQALPDEVPELKDVVEMDSRYIVGITYPPEANRYPGLAAELYAYARSARDELMQAVEGAADLQPGTMYDLSLRFSVVADTPALLAIAADGSTYTGGAHDNPLIERFVWLVPEQKLLLADDLLTDADGWVMVSRFVREQLHAALSQRIDADELEPDERSRMLRTAGRMIDEGSEPDVTNFRQFEPVLGRGDRLAGLRFVFPPYQVGPYSDGIQTVEVPASVLLPYVAAPYRGLFAAD